MKTRKEMVEYLVNHFRYDTMNSWNRGTSYAANLKIHRVIPHNLQDKVFEMMDTDYFYSEINDFINQWDKRQGYMYQAGFNGRSGGYLVMYNGLIKDGKVECYPGQSIDQDEDFEDWSFEDIKNRVKLVQSFDKLAQDIINHVIYMAENYTIEEVEYTEVKTYKTLVS